VTPRAWIYFAAVSVLWGIPYLLIKVAVDDGVSPEFLAWCRCAIGAAVLAPFAWRSGALKGLGRRWKTLLVFSVIEIILPWPLIAAGEQRVSSSLAAILIATVPLVVALIAMRIDHEERPTGRRLVGLLAGFAGVIALLGIDVAGDTEELIGALLILVAAVGYAIGPMIIKSKLSDVHPLGPVTASLAISALILTPAAVLAPPDHAPSTESLLSIVALGVACSAVAFVFFFALIAEAGPSRGTIITYVNPIVAVALGIALLDERIGPGAAAGLLMILAGSWLATGGRRPAEPQPGPGHEHEPSFEATPVG
jgi:drug/metabolite transporter (DMT)-like permease